MPRESADAKAVSLAFAKPMLKAPDTLTAEQSEVWGRVVASKPDGWFDQGSAPLLAAYCREVLEARRIGKLLDDFQTEWMADDEGLKRYERLKKLAKETHALMCSLSVKLRISPSASMRAENAITKAGQAKGRQPWAVIEHDQS